MNWDRIEGNWKQVTGKAKEQWGKLTDDDFDVIKGRLTHFMRRDELEAAWKWVEPIMDGWTALDEKPKPYTAGSWGPSAAVALIERDGRTWHEDAA